METIFNWKKGGLIYSASGKNGFDLSHCHKPTPLLIDNDTIRVYFGARDSSGKTRTTFIDINRQHPEEIKYIHTVPVLDIGKIGAFDDSGANVSSVMRVGNLVYMYFIGWNPSTTVHTRNSIGLAISEDGGYSFSRLYDGAILDRTKTEPYYTGAVDVHQENGLFKIWYTSGSEWKIINGKPEIFYHIKYAESNNGIDWERQGISCIAPNNEFEATARPSVIKLDKLYYMWYSRRDIRNFRNNPEFGYKGGFATSSDGIRWKRQDEKFGLPTSKDGWDSFAIAYPYVIDVGDRYLMFYNGNGFGKTGFGYAFSNKLLTAS